MPSRAQRLSITELKKGGYEVISASNGIEGIELLEEVNEDFPKSILILSDERNNSLIANQEKVAIESALEKNVAIYSLKYCSHFGFSGPLSALQFAQKNSS